MVKKIFALECGGPVRGLSGKRHFSSIGLGRFLQTGTFTVMSALSRDILNERCEELRSPVVVFSSPTVILLGKAAKDLVKMTLPLRPGWQRAPWVQQASR